MMLKICQMMENRPHYKFVEKNDAYKCCPGDHSSHDSFGLGCCCRCIAYHIKFSADYQIGLEHVDEVEDYQGQGEEENTEAPSYKYSEFFVGLVFQIGPYYFFGSWRLLKSDVLSPFSKVVF